jgi:hypothetical protein
VGIKLSSGECVEERMWELSTAESSDRRMEKKKKTAGGGEGV